jgi:hypothetical protein
VSAAVGQRRAEAGRSLVRLHEANDPGDVATRKRLHLAGHFEANCLGIDADKPATEIVAPHHPHHVGGGRGLLCSWHREESGEFLLEDRPHAGRGEFEGPHAVAGDDDFATIAQPNSDRAFVRAKHLAGE